MREEGDTRGKKGGILAVSFMNSCSRLMFVKVSIGAARAILPYFSCGGINHAYAFHLNCRCVHPRGGVIQSVSSWKHGSGTQYVSTRQTQSWTAVTPQQTWASPAEVVDLTLDEDSRRKYLL